MALQTNQDEGETTTSSTSTTTDMIISCDRSQIMDRLKAMRIQEASTAYRCSDYLSSLPSESHHVDSWCRSKMVGWCFQVVDCIGFHRETVLYAIAYVDRFLSLNTQRSQSVLQDRQQFQLAIMTALFIAIKLHERKIIDVSLMVDFSRGVFTRDDFMRMESDLLAGLNWRLTGPTAISFLQHFAHLMPFQEYGISTCDIVEMARYRIELSTNDYSITSHSPSKVAVAALISSIKSHTAIPELFCHRPKLLNDLQEISEINLNSASLRDIVQRTERYEDKPFIMSRRQQGVSCIASKWSKECNKSLEGSHTHSPRGVSNEIIDSKQTRVSS
jgi:Cyclin